MGRRLAAAGSVVGRGVAEPVGAGPVAADVVRVDLGPSVAVPPVVTAIAALPHVAAVASAVAFAVAFAIAALPHVAAVASAVAFAPRAAIAARGGRPCICR